MSPGRNGDAPAQVAWNEAREVIVIVLLVAVASMMLAPILARVIDGQLDRDGLVSATTGVQPLAGLALLAAAVLVVTTPAEDVVPVLRTAVSRLSLVAVVLGAIAILDILFSPADGGVRRFFGRFATILRFSGPATLLAATAWWTARRVGSDAGR